MKLTSLTKRALAQRRFIREWEAKGYEEIGEGGGRLWELYRGYRTDCRITDAKVPPGGRSIWVKIEPDVKPFTT
jgi:hypothetical protein